jgi:hypothetical protein
MACHSRFPSDKSVEVVVTLKEYRDQAAIVGPDPKPGFSVNSQVGDNHQDAVVAVAEVLNQFRHGFTEGDAPGYAEAFSEALNDPMAKHWPEGIWASTQSGPSSADVPPDRDLKAGLLLGHAAGTGLIRTRLCH